MTLAAAQLGVVIARRLDGHIGARKMAHSCRSAGVRGRFQARTVPRPREPLPSSEDGWRGHG